MRTTVYVNGKFLAQRTTGVQRYAGELVKAMDEVMADSGAFAGRVTLVCPPGTVTPRLRALEVRQLGPVHRPLHLWEQVVLPAVARDGVLLSLSGSAPALHPRQVCTMHDAAVFDHAEAYRRAFVTWYRWLFSRLSRTALEVITVSDFSRAALRRHLAFRGNAPVVIPNAAEHMDGIVPEEGVLDRLGLAGGRFLLAVASANPTKNLGALVRASRMVRERTGVGLVVVGGRNAAVFASAGEATSEYVCWAGVVTDGELKVLYQTATAFVFPSIYEGFGLPALEAMRCGCPVIAAAAAAIPEVCRDAAEYFDPTDEAAIAATISRVVQDAPVLARMREHGLERSRQYSWRRSAEQLLQMLSTFTA